MLTEHQNKKLQETLDILKLNTRVLIKGSAGVGKTFMVNELTKQLKTSKKILCTAPTNKAVKVLMGKVNKLYNLEFSTTHAALKIKMSRDYKTGEAIFKPSFDKRYPPLKDVGILIVDEASMLNTELLGYIEQYADRYNVKVIFIGDEKQINPVGEEDSIVFHSGFPEVELTEIIRQGEGNPIIELSRNLDMINSETDRTNMSFEGELTGFVFSNDKQKVIETLATVNGTDDLKYLCWTNKEADLMNFLVRRRIYGNPKKVEVGETMIFNTPYKEEFTANEEVKIVAIEEEEKSFQYIFNKAGVVNPGLGEEPYYADIKLKYYLIDVDRDKELVVVHEESEEKFKNFLNNYKKKAIYRDIDWVDYYKFVDQFADLKYNHALTIHKSQGSTFKQAILNVRNVELNRDAKEKKRLKYTAVTRASDLLILYNY